MGILFAYAVLLVPIILLLLRRRPAKNLPPGSLGIPIIGQSITLLRKMRANTCDEWFQERVRKYGPISKLSLFGKPTVFINGPAANKFIFSGDNTILANSQPISLQRILGNRNLLELMGKDHKRVREALLSFLRPDSLKKYVGKLEIEIREHLEKHWEGKQQVTVLPLMKTLTFNIICSILFGIEHGDKRERFVDFFDEAIKGMWSVPVPLPFTQYNRSIKASEKVRKMVKDRITEKRMELKEKGSSHHQDLITCLLSIRDEENKEVISEKEIADNVMLAMVAGHETSATVLTFMIRALANNPEVYAAVLHEQEQIAKSKRPGEFLTWEDLASMKYTWRVAMETMRLVPPVFAGFRTALKDIEYGGYLIPKGWQVFWAMSMTHMESSLFPEPTRFDPSRFENLTSVPPYSFIPFGGGPRVCPGQEFAKLEILVATHYLITRFTWKLCGTNNFFTMDPTPKPTKGLRIEIQPRKY